MNILKRLWHDQRGFVISSELILVSVIVVLGLIVGLTTMRDQLVQEFGDLGAAIGALNHSYTFAPVVINGFSVAGSNFDDESDFCDEGDTAGEPPGCIEFGVNASDEGG